MEDEGQKAEGARERKRRETRDRIAETGLRLFVENGYEATTLEAIAAASGISRRTFFYYFKSKEEVLLAHDGNGFVEALRVAVIQESPAGTPLQVARKCLLEFASKYETEDSIVADRLLRSTEALRLRKEAVYVEIERVLFEAFCHLWPDPARRQALRVVAMIVIGTLRLSMDDWRAENGRRPLAKHIDRSFAVLKAQMK